MCGRRCHSQINKVIDTHCSLALDLSNTLNLLSIHDSILELFYTTIVIAIYVMLHSQVQRTESQEHKQKFTSCFLIGTCDFTGGHQGYLRED